MLLTTYRHCSLDSTVQKRVEMQKDVTFVLQLPESFLRCSANQCRVDTGLIEADPGQKKLAHVQPQEERENLLEDHPVGLEET
jgi:hypothetical protein